MTFGTQYESEKEAFVIMDKAYDFGVNFYDTAEIYFAIVWSKQFDFVASTIIGATTTQQLDASLAAMNIKLSNEVMQACDAVHKEMLYPMG